MPEPDEDGLRRELSDLLAASPSRAELEKSYAGRILAWLATPNMLLDTGSKGTHKRKKKRPRPALRR